MSTHLESQEPPPEHDDTRVARGRVVDREAAVSQCYNLAVACGRRRVKRPAAILPSDEHTRVRQLGRPPVLLRDTGWEYGIEGHSRQTSGGPNSDAHQFRVALCVATSWSLEL